MADEPTKSVFISKNKLKEMMAGNPDIKTEDDQADFLKALESEGHEIEGFNSSFNLGESLSNIPESAKELGTSLVGILKTNPFQTAETLSSVARGALRKVLPNFAFTAGAKLRQALPNVLGGTDLNPEQQKAQDEQALAAVLDGLSERYGSLDKAKNTAEKDPVGFVSDVASVFAGGGAGAEKLAATTAKLAPKASAALARTAEVLNYASKVTDPINIAAKTAGKTASLLEGQVASKTLERINDFRLRRLLDKTDVNEQMLEGLGIEGAQREKLSQKLKTLKAGEKLAKIGVTGTLPEMSEQLAEIGSKTKLLFDKSLETIPDRIKAPVTDKIIQEIASLKTRVPFSVMSKKAQDAYVQLADLYRSNKGGGLTLSELNEIKRGMYEIVDDKAFKNPATPAISQAKKNAGQLYNEIQSVIETEAAKRGVKNVKELNRQTQFTGEFKKIIDSKIARGGDKVVKSKLLSEHMNNIIHQAVINQSKLGQLTALTKVFFQVSRSPQFRRDLATAVQLLTDGEFKKLEGGIKFAREQTAAETKLLGKQAKIVANRQAQQVIDGIVQDLSKAYPVLRGLRIAGNAQATIDKQGRIRMPETTVTASGK